MDIEELYKDKSAEEVVARKRKGSDTVYAVCGVVFVVLFVLTLILLAFAFMSSDVMLPQLMSTLCFTVICLGGFVSCFTTLSQYKKVPEKIIIYQNGLLHLQDTVRRPREITDIKVKKQGGVGSYYKIKLFFGAVTYDLNFIADGDSVVQRLYQLKFEDSKNEDFKSEDINRGEQQA